MVELRWDGGGPMVEFPTRPCPSDNVIAYNRVSKTQQVLGGDGGAIYVIGNQPGSKIEGNYVTESPRCIFPVIKEPDRWSHREECAR